MKNIVFSQELSQSIFDFLDDYSQIVLLVDENTHQLCYPLLKKYLNRARVITIKSGEMNKNLDSCRLIWQALTDMGMDRHGVLINLGGGVIGDMGGFCASTYKRGIDFVQIPTTLLAQVDASVGGKLGIDFQGYKNHIGIFQYPAKIIIHPPFLKTLDQRQLRSGFAEVIKHSLIKDKNQWQTIIQKGLDQQNWQELIYRSIHIKYHIVQKDPKEHLGIRQALNFGHTIGHAVERHFLTDKKRYLLHGEAVALGMLCESFLSWQKNKLLKPDFEQIIDYISEIYGTPTIYLKDIEALIKNTLQDKKMTEI